MVAEKGVPERFWAELFLSGSWTSSGELSSFTPQWTPSIRPVIDTPDPASEKHASGP